MFFNFFIWGNSRGVGCLVPGIASTETAGGRADRRGKSPLGVNQVCRQPWTRAGRSTSGRWQSLLLWWSERPTGTDQTPLARPLVPAARASSPRMWPACGPPWHRDVSSCLASGPFCLSAAAVFRGKRVWSWKRRPRGRVLQRPWRETQPGCGQQKPIQLGQRGLRIHNHPK